MQSPEQTCLICLTKSSELKTIQKSSQLKTIQTCGHAFCSSCLKQYIETLKKYNLLTPTKLICLAQQCNNELSDNLINQLYPGEEGFVLNVVRKRYKESLDPSIKIFNCKGFTKMNRQHLVEKTPTMSRQVHTQLMNEKLRNMVSQVQVIEDKKICTNIISFNKFNTKDKFLQCYVCGVSYCPKCQQFCHQSLCKVVQSQIDLNKYKKSNEKVQTGQQNFAAFIKANQIAVCLNPKCGLPIAKEEGCFWVKCRCSWEFCYPCHKIWGDCQHFTKYPYKKFVPPPDWMVKALNLY